tara:strand:- start:7585 stop:8229 length:645 start_codon:yes stop_codon:yes gene_type:complete
MKISVIIRNRDEEKHIGYCLQSVVDFLGIDLQVILVDNCSTDNSIRIANTFDYLSIDKLEISRNGYTPGKALNLGVKKATGDLILIISAHCEISSFNLDQAIMDLKDNIAVWGKQIPIWDGKKISRRYMWSNFEDESSINHYCKFEDRYFFHNAFSLFMREDLLKFPFNEDISGKEDRIWANERIEAGQNIKYESNFIAKHHYTIHGATWKGTG